jgi:cyclohexadienyl dehydratase
LIAQYPELMIVPVSAPRAKTPVAMLMPQGDQVWINYVNTWITLKQDAGLFDELAVKWQLSN